MALPGATGMPVEVHTAGMPHYLVMVRTSAKYLVASKIIYSRRCLRYNGSAAVKKYSETALID